MVLPTKTDSVKSPGRKPVYLTQSARRELDGLSPLERAAVVRKVLRVSHGQVNGQPVKASEYTGVSSGSVFRVRAGNHRILYESSSKKLKVLAVLRDPRANAFESLALVLLQYTLSDLYSLKTFGSTDSACDAILQPKYPGYPLVLVAVKASLHTRHALQDDMGKLAAMQKRKWLDSLCLVIVPSGIPTRSISLAQGQFLGTYSVATNTLKIDKLRRHLESLTVGEPR